MIICEHKDKPLEYRYTKRKTGNEFERQRDHGHGIGRDE